MMNNLASQYYIKAKDNYPYDLEESMESLQYALSYDEAHAASHCLMGRFHLEQFGDYEAAFHHFELALFHRFDYAETYYHYSIALIRFNALEKADKLIRKAETLPGVSQVALLHRKALIAEKKQRFQHARFLLKTALKQSIENDETDYLKKELERVKSKTGKKKNTKLKKKKPGQ